MKLSHRSCTVLSPLWSIILVVTACGAPKETSSAPNGNAEAPAYTWDQVCDAARERLSRCPTEAKADGPFVKRCSAARNDRACFDTFNDNTAHFLMTCIKNTPCGGKDSIFNRCAAKLFTDVPLDDADLKKQDACRTHMASCNLPFEERCIAPFLRESLHTPVSSCVELPCGEVRRCTEGILEQVGCR